MRTLNYRPRPDEPGPAEIVKRLHDKIAARSPEDAVLVAKWNRRQAELRRAEAAKVQPREGRGRQERILEFGDLLEQGLSPEEAAAVVGVTLDTASRYKAALRRQGALPGAGHPASRRDAARPDRAART